MGSILIRLALAVMLCMAVPGVSTAAATRQAPGDRPEATRILGGDTSRAGAGEDRSNDSGLDGDRGSSAGEDGIADTLFVEQPPGSGVYGVIAGRVTELNRQYIRIVSDSAERLIVRKATRRVILDYSGHRRHLADSIRKDMSEDPAALSAFDDALGEFELRSMLNTLEELTDAVDDLSSTPIDQIKQLITDRQGRESDGLQAVRQDTVLAGFLWRVHELDQWRATIDIDWNRDESAIVNAVQNAPVVGGWFKFLDDVDPRVGTWLAALAITLGLLYVIYRTYGALAARAFERQLVDAKLHLDAARSRLELLDVQRRLGLPEDPPLGVEDMQLIRKAAAALHLPPPRWLQKARWASEYFSVASSTERSRRQVLRVLGWIQKHGNPRAARAVLMAWMGLHTALLLVIWALVLSAFIMVLAVIQVLAESPGEGVILLGMLVMMVLAAVKGSQHEVGWLRMARQLSIGVASRIHSAER